MDHLVIPLDPDHVQALDGLARNVAAAAGVGPEAVPPRPHVTLIAHTGLPLSRVAVAVEPVVTAAAPFAIYAHGYGLFTGPDARDLSLHVPVVRGGPLDELHARLCEALRRAGAEVAGWSTPALWSPHITLADRQLDPLALGRAVRWLAQRRHPSWRIPVERVAVTGGWRQRHRSYAVLPLGGPTDERSSESAGPPPAAAGARGPAVASSRPKDAGR